MKGWILYQRGQFGRSIDLFDHSLAALEKSRQPQNVATLHLLNASNFTFLGEPLRAEAHLQLALGFISQVLKRRWAVTIFEEAAKAARINGYLLSSVQFLDEAVGVALQDGNPAVLNEALLSRALAHHELADTPAAVQDLQSAENWLDRIKDPPVHRLMEAQFLAARGEVLRESAPDRAIIDLSKALEDRSSSGMATETTALHLERGRAYLASRQLDKAEADFTAGIQAFEQHRRSVSEEQLRISYFDKAREIFDDMIALQIDVHHNSRQALEFSERARARELLDTVYGRPADGTSDIEAIRRNLPRDTQILYYVVLKNEILAWILSSKGSGFVRWHASSEELQRDNELLVRAMESGAPADQIEAAASKLYDALILPLGRGLIPSERLIIVPDKFLFTVPFSVLIDSRSHHYLVEEYAISVSPSLLLLSHALKRGALFDRPCAGRILVVGNPAFDRNRFPRLLRLPGSEEEARQIAAIYPDSKVLLDREATKTAFLDAAGQYEIVHFGGHAISNEEFPLLSRFVLAPDLRTGDGGSLLAHEIYGHRFPKTRLVVLAACSTARARVSPGEGALSLARPFLAAGVPSVVASLWDINDEQSRFLFDTFHRLVAEGLPPHQALHEAQIRIRRQNLHPSVWAAFEVIEGSS
jgi:CHAT domain-containing protein